MKTKLKQFRVRAGMTQAKLAEKVGVTQPNYQRWESGSAPIPEEKLKKLAKVLRTSPEAVLGRHPPKEARFYDDSAGDDLNYYGEVAIHFCGGGAPLLLSISEEAFSSLHHDLQLNPAFVTVKSLEPISKSPEEDNEASELYETEEVLGVVFTTDEDAALPLNPSKEALHEPASHIAA